jgi:hypothetical protein
MAGTVELGHGRVLASQALAFAASSATATNPFGSQTYQVRLAATAACHYRIGNGTLTAVAADPLLPAGAIEYVMVNPGESIAAIQDSAGGNLTITELG